jgi:hypothetical protein
MSASGLAGAMGGARVKVTSTDPQEIILPIPQLVGGQVPVCCFVSTTPADAATDFRLRARDDCNVWSPSAWRARSGRSEEVELVLRRAVQDAPPAVLGGRKLTKLTSYNTSLKREQTFGPALKKLTAELKSPDATTAEETAFAVEKLNAYGRRLLDDAMRR